MDYALCGADGGVPQTLAEAVVLSLIAVEPAIAVLLAEPVVVQPQCWNEFPADATIVHCMS